MEKYDIISVVGEGSYGLVMRCRHRESGQYVAIKKFLETEDDPTVRKMALREIRMLKKLRHENLVNMIEVFRRKKRFFLVFEYLEHTVLEELEARSGGLGYITSRKYIYQVLRALDFIHSHDVIHRDIKPENVLVSRLGVIKLCDFGFARPYMENETFTDYVATRWYRSPELLVGDRYGKEVDIWAVGCLYSEMMTGEPLFPGESDIDQLFQIVRVLGKLSSRHQILIMRNAMFKGMKQEQNTSLTQLFPNWNRDSIDFLAQCLKMDGITRPDTGKLLKNDLFVRDNFLDNFLIELRTKLAQEMQVNPLLKRIPSYGSNSRRNSDEKRNSNNSNQTLVTSMRKSNGDESKMVQDKMGKINLSLLTAANSIKPSSIDDENTIDKSVNSIVIDEIGSDSLNNENDIDDDELTRLNLVSSIGKSHLSGGGGVTNPAKPSKISINNLIFKDSGKYTRILSAKLLKTVPNMIVNEKSMPQTNGASSNQNGNNFDINFQSPSPVHFQSLQLEASSIGHAELLVLPNKRLSPVTLITNSQIGSNSSTNTSNATNVNLPQHYFNYRRHSNALAAAAAADVQLSNKSHQLKQNQIPIGRNGVMTKRERDRTHQLLDVSLMPINNNFNSIAPSNEQTTIKEPSPRILPPPQWLTGNLRLTGQGGKGTQIGNISNNNNGKRRITDWKSVGIATNGTNNKYSMQNENIYNTNATNNISNNNNNNAGNDLVLPTCPGATISPKKSSNNSSLKKKFPAMGNFPQENILLTPRNFSASSDHINET